MADPCEGATSSTGDTPTSSPSTSTTTPQTSTATAPAPTAASPAITSAAAPAPKMSGGIMLAAPAVAAAALPTPGSPATDKDPVGAEEDPVPASWRASVEADAAAAADDADVLFDGAGLWARLRKDVGDVAAAAALAEHAVRMLTAARAGGSMERAARRTERAAGVRPAEVGGVEVEDEGEDEGRESVYGEGLLLSLRCEERKRDGFERYSRMDVELLLNEYSEGLGVCGEEGRVVAVGALVMQAFPALLFTLVEGLEVGDAGLVEACRRVMGVMARDASPREFMVMLKLSVSKVSGVDARPFYRIVLDDLLGYWSECIPRITGKRSLFLADVVRTLDLSFFNDSHGESSSPMEDDADDAAFQAETMVPSPREAALLRLIARLSAVQKEDMAKTAEEHEFGVDDPDLFPPEAQARALQGAENKSEDNREKKLLAALRTAVLLRETAAQDFANERIGTLALLLRLVAPMVPRLPRVFPPEYETRIAADRRLRNMSKQNSDISTKGLKEFVVTARRLYRELGFDNVVDACQRVSDLCGYEFLDTSAQLVSEVSRPQQRRNRKSLTYFGITEVAHYLVMMLMFTDEGVRRKSVKAAFEQSPLALLSPEYAFDLLMPFVLHLVGHSSHMLAVHGTEFLRVMLERIPDGAVQGYVSALRHPYGEGFTQSNGAWYGFAMALVRAVGYMDHPLDRAFVYETFQVLLGKISCPCTRFSIVEALVLESHRHIVSSQLITELKDCVRIIDRTRPPAEAEAYRTRMMHFILPRFLLPRKESLASMCTVAASCNAALFCALSDAHSVSSPPIAASPALHASVVRRMRFMLRYLKMGRDAVRAIAATAEHDRKQTNDLTNPRHACCASPRAHGLFAAASRTLNDCVASKTAMDQAIDRLGEALRAVDSAQA